MQPHGPRLSAEDPAFRTIPMIFNAPRLEAVV